jgi:glutathione S-transferase
MKAFAPTPPDPAIMAWLKTRIDAAYGVVDKHLAAQPYLVGAQPTIADFSLSGYVFYPLEESGYDVDGRFANIASWRERLKTIPGWASPYEVLPGERISPKR